MKMNRRCCTIAGRTDRWDTAGLGDGVLDAGSLAAIAQSLTRPISQPSNVHTDALRPAVMISPVGHTVTVIFIGIQSAMLPVGPVGICMGRVVLI